MAVTGTLTIDAPPDKVFAILADPRQHSRIDGSGTVLDSVTGPKRLTLGSEFSMSMKQGVPYTIKNKVVEFDEGRTIAWRHIGLHRWRYQLAPTDSGACVVTETWDISPYPGPMRVVMAKLFAKKTQAGIDATLPKLKAAAESDAVS
ncbi:SRPBCC family protein [Nocardioides acrostichi]|uniref:SRPBCC family protein n=1 Tax=Nocardioides acrostichi TaxID=2784339 RepID=A0A930UUQ2_9ACTN|nr:SRPBCC family protein [Nocardioides acrostichi]MBF4161193.1 SRPBCC family protein [Nocardioides acrostichi]